MAQQTAAILTTFNECDMTAVMALRKKSQDAFTKKHGLKLGFMSFFIKAVVEALESGARDQFAHRRRRLHPEPLFRHRRRGRAPNAAWSCRWCAMRTRRASPISKSDIAGLRGQGARRENQDRGFAGRHVHHFQWRRLRFASEHADFESAAERHSRACTPSSSGRWRSTARSSSAR